MPNIDFERSVTAAMFVGSPVTATAVSGVGIVPGAIALTRMPCGPSSLAIDFVSPTMAVFDAV